MTKRNALPPKSCGGGDKRLKVQEHASSISNVELMRSLRLSSMPLSSKIDQAWKFVEGQKKGSMVGGVPMPQFVSFLAGWIQWEMMKGVEGVAMDARSWTIFHWCLSSQKNLHIYPGMLKAIDLVLRTKVMKMEDRDQSMERNYSEDIKVVVLEVLELLLHSYDRTFRPQLLDWTVFASSFFEALLRSELNDDVMKVGTLIADGFGKFLTTQANSKAAFQALVEKVFSPLLELMGVLINEKKDGEVAELLRDAVARVLDNGLFHTVSLEGFPGVCTTASRWLADSKDQVREWEGTASSHKLLFEKLKQSRQERSFTALASLGELLRLFARSFKCHRASMKSDIFGNFREQEETEATENQRDATDGEPKSVHVTDNQQQFLVFMELSLPLILELTDEKDVCGKRKLLLAVNNLFGVAQEQAIYVPTKDTPTNGHFNFVKLYCKALLDYAQSLSSLSNRELRAAGYRELVRGMSCVLDIDHRAADGGVENFWRILLSATATDANNETAIAQIVAVGCQMLGEVRNLGALLILFSSVKCTHAEDGLQPSEFANGLKRFLCDPLFLKALRKMVESMPEAQAPEVVNMVSRDAVEAFQMVENSEVAQAVVMASGELHAQILESLNVASGNAHQVGINVRQLVDSVLAEPLRHLLTKISKGKTGRNAERTGLKFYFLLRLYLICRTLHRQCLSLMPPQKAEKAAVAAHELQLDSLEIDWMELSVDPQDLSTFAWIGQPVSIPALINELSWMASNTSPSLYYLMDLLAIQRLNDLQRYIHSVEYFEAKLIASSVEDPVMTSLGEDSMDHQGRNLSQEGVHQLLRDFRAEAKQLVALLLEGDSYIQWQASVNSSKVERRKEAVASLTKETIYAARWQLILRTIDVWSKHASKKSLRSCLTSALVSAEDSITRELFQNLLVCENQRVQSSLLPAAWDAASKLLNKPLKFKEFKKPFLDLFNGSFAIELLRDSTMERCITLLQLIASFPWAHNKKLDTVQCIFCMCYIEVLALNMLKGIANDDTVGNPIVPIFELFAACRRAIYSFASSRSKQIGNGVSQFDIDLFSWMHRSVTMAADFAVQLKPRKWFRHSGPAIDTSLALVIKSSQAYVRHIAQHIFTLGSRRLLIEPLQFPTVSADEETKFVASCMQPVISTWDTEDYNLQSYGQLGAISFGTGLLCAAAETITVLDRKCQEDKSKGLRWTTAIPWMASLRSVEDKIAAMLLEHIAGTHSSGTSILDVFLDSKPAETNAPEVEAPPDDQEEDGLVGDNDSEEDEEGEKSETSSNEAAEDTDMIDANDATFQLDLPPKADLSWLFESSMPRQQFEIVGELFMAMGALMKLRSLYFSPYARKASAISKTPAAPSVTPLLRLLYSLLTKAASTMYHAAADSRVDLFWLSGAVKCMESLGLVLPSVDPSLSRAEFLKLLRMHIDLLGAVLWLQSSETRCDGNLHVDMSCFYGDLKGAVRESFCALIKFASIPHLLLAFQTIQEALSGSSKISEYNSILRLGDCDDGRVGVVIAASVECLAAALDVVSGPTRLKILAKYSPRFIAGLVNLITCLQGPAMFHKDKRYFIRVEARPATISSSSVLLQSLEVLTRIASREAIFPMRPTHVALAMHCPVAILRPAYQFKLPHQRQQLSPCTELDESSLDTEIVLKFYVASCKLLYTLLRHRKRESGRSIALLGESLRVSLYCLESSLMTTNSAVQCARWLRRVYEELGEQKETLGRYCMNVLSDYLAVLSGSGPFGAGLDRDVDKELRLGIYALLTSSQDLQQLHAALGEGPLRTNLTMLKNDYEKKFKYTGKI